MQRKTLHSQFVTLAFWLVGLSPLVAAQINGASLAAGGDSMPDVDLFTAAVCVMNDHAVKLNRRAVDSDLNILEPAAPAAHVNPVAIHSSIQIGLSQINPTAG